MGGKNSSPSTPQFVKDAAQNLAGRSESIWNLSRPLMETSTGQIASLIRTGGVGANVPIINNAVAAQESAGRLALSGFEGTTKMGTRGNVPAAFQKRQREYVGRETSSAARRIPFQAAAPLIGGGVSSALTGGRSAQAGLAGAVSALAAGQRLPNISQNLQGAGSNLMLAALYGANGGFGSFSGAGKGIGSGSTNPFGSGISPTGGFILGNNGLLGGGV